MDIPNLHYFISLRHSLKFLVLNLFTLKKIEEGNRSIVCFMIFLPFSIGTTTPTLVKFKIFTSIPSTLLSLHKKILEEFEKINPQSSSPRLALQNMKIRKENRLKCAKSSHCAGTYNKDSCRPILIRLAFFVCVQNRNMHLCIRYHLPFAWKRPSI